MEAIECDLSWELYFEQEVAKHKVLDAPLIEAIRSDLLAKDKRLKPPLWADDARHQSHMVEEARAEIVGALKMTQQRLRLQHYDEWRNGLMSNVVTAATTDSVAIYDELDDLLEELVAGDDDTSASNGTSAGNGSETGNSEPVLSCSGKMIADSNSVGLFDLASYAFPDTEHLQADLVSLSNAELRSRLDHLLHQRGLDGKLICYLDIRDECCAIGEVMNRRGIQPPKLRPQRSLPMLPKGQKYDVPDTVMSRDRQVLDLHWLHCRGKRDRIEHKAYGDLFTGDEFDFDLAVQFACKGWSLASKTVKVLDLIDFEQMQMAFFRMKHIDDAWKNGFSSMNTTISKRLREYVVKEPEFAMHIEGLKRLWLAEKMVAVADLDGEKIIGLVYGWLMNEEPLTKGTMNAKLKRMRRRTTPKSRRS